MIVGAYIFFFVYRSAARTTKKRYFSVVIIALKYKARTRRAWNQYIYFAKNRVPRATLVAMRQEGSDVSGVRAILRR